ncbi:MAG: hypothetical protein FOGNACKC_00841 [Anaerolineae bacterium]|nr:hypothetical protein [Anaerolineae bacterium]
MNNSMVGHRRLSLFLDVVGQTMRVKREQGVCECLVLHSAVIDAANVFNLDLSLFEMMMGDEVMVYTVVRTDSGDDGGQTDVMLSTFAAREAYKLAVEKLDEILAEQWPDYQGVPSLTDETPDQKILDLYEGLRVLWLDQDEHSEYGLENWWVERNVIRLHGQEKEFSGD